MPAPPLSAPTSTPTRAAETARAIVGEHGKAESAQIDVSQRGAAETLVGHIVARHGGLHVMCNIAGIMIDSSIIDLDPDEFDRILGVNLKGVLYGCQAAGKVMVAQGGGSIINMSSTAVLAPSPGIGPYAICKAGVAQLTKSMAVEVGKQGGAGELRGARFRTDQHDGALLHQRGRDDRRGDEGSRAVARWLATCPCAGSGSPPTSRTACCTSLRTPAATSPGR